MLKLSPNSSGDATLSLPPRCWDEEEFWRINLTDCPAVRQVDWSFKLPSVRRRLPFPGGEGVARVTSQVTCEIPSLGNLSPGPVSPSRNIHAPPPPRFSQSLCALLHSPGCGGGFQQAPKDDGHDLGKPVQTNVGKVWSSPGLSMTPCGPYSSFSAIRTKTPRSVTSERGSQDMK